MSAASRRIRPLLPALLLAGLTACTGVFQAPPAEPLPEGAEPGGQILTRSDIERTRARNALEAIERGSTHLLIARTREGRPVKISHRGADSLVFGNHIMLVVDGSRVKHPEQMLRNIPAHSIAFIQILSGREAAMKWGSESGNGVIMVRTSAK